MSAAFIYQTKPHFFCLPALYRPRSLWHPYALKITPLGIGEYHA